MQDTLYIILYARRNAQHFDVTAYFLAFAARLIFSRTSNYNANAKWACESLSAFASAAKHVASTLSSYYVINRCDHLWIHHAERAQNDDSIYFLFL